MRRALLLLLLLAAGARASDEEVRELLGEAAADDPYRRKVARKQILARGAEAVPVLVAAAAEEGAEREAAIELLGALGNASGPVVGTLTKALADPAPRVRVLAAKALAGLGPEARPAQEHLLALGADGGVAERFAARDALQAIGGGVAEPLLARLAAAEEPPSWILGVFHDLGAKALPAALAALESPEESVRAAAAAALGEAGGELAVPALVKALHDERALVRRRAARALGVVGADSLDALPALVHLAADGERRAIPEALEAMGAIARDAAGRAYRVPPPRPPVRAAIARGLDWLVRHQDEDGRWDCADFDKHAPQDRPNGGGGGQAYDVGVTGLACLALLESGDPERHAAALRAGLRWLVSVQGPEGRYGGTEAQHYMYNHAIACLAVAAAARIQGDPAYREAARKGVAFTLAARNLDAAWRYVPRGGDNDVSVTGWCVLSLFEAEAAGIGVGPLPFEGALRWVDEVTDERGRTGYNSRNGMSARPEAMRARFPEEKTRASTAEAVVVRLACGQEAKHPLVRAGVDRVLEILPDWNPEGGTLDMYAWFHGTRALAYAGGSQRWTRALLDASLPSQAREGIREGSWDPAGPWGPDGGRVYATATMVLCLEAASGLARPLVLRVPKDARLRMAMATLQRALGHEEARIRETARQALARLAP